MFHPLADLFMKAETPAAGVPATAPTLVYILFGLKFFFNFINSGLNVGSLSLCYNCREADLLAPDPRVSAIHREMIQIIWGRILSESINLLWRLGNIWPT